MSSSEVVWRPDEASVAQANLTAFMRRLDVPDYDALVHLADAAPERFHEALIDFAGLPFVRPYTRLVDESAGPAHVRWCVGATTNATLGCLDRWLESGRGCAPALVWEGEDGEARTFTYAQLDADARRLAGALRDLGVEPGDVVGVYLPNIPEAVHALLAIAKIGAVALPLFSGFGADALATRLADAGARVLLTVDGALRRGKVVGAKRVVDAAAARVPCLDHVVVLRHRDAPAAWVDGRDHWWDELLASATPHAATEAVDAEWPLLLVYTSGTTGRPKGVVHCHCGFALKLALDLGLCMDFKPGDRLLWMSDMGWLVGPILVFGALLLGGTIVLVEGTPGYPEPDRIWRLAATHRVTHLGVAPSVVRSMIPDERAHPGSHDLSSLRCFPATGEPWDRQAWMWLFEKAGRGRIPILNYTGGTEIGGILVATPIHPLKPCAFSGPVPGTGADVVDAQGRSVPPGVVGELVMRRPSIGLTRGLWHDEARYIESYWSAIPGVWTHGDLVSRDADGFWFVHGRSDDTLNVAGKRTGPAEVEGLALAGGLAVEVAAIGTPDAIKGTALLVFCVPAPAASAHADPARAVADAIVAGLGAAFRPRAVLFVPALPRTRNMKVMRRVVRTVWHGEDPGDLGSLVNPECIEPLAALAREQPVPPPVE